METEVIGVYRIKESDEPWFLVEMWVPGDRALDFDQITQEEENTPWENWQAPYDEMIIDDDGEKVVISGFACKNEQYWGREKNRILFFFYNLNTEKELITPYGRLALPKESPLPDRLSFIEIELPY